MKTRYAMTALSLALLAAATFYDVVAHGRMAQGRATAQTKISSVLAPEQETTTASEMLELLVAQGKVTTPLPESGGKRKKSPQR